MVAVSLSGGDKLEAKLADIARKIAAGGTLRVGFLEGATYPDGTPVAQVAAIQNFGAPAAGIPPRPFFSNFVKDNSDEWGETLAAILQATNFNVMQALEMMGARMAGQLRESIIDTNEPPLSAVTLLLRDRFANHDDITFADVQQARADIAAGVVPRASGSAAKPLVWTGHMLASIDHEVTGDG